jgi:hypothetical protein
MSRIIASVVFYSVSLITVGLLAGLVPQQTQEITILATAKQTSTITTTASIATTTVPLITATSTSTIATTTASITATLITATTTIRTTTKIPDPAECVEDECNPRLSTYLEVHNYQLVYIYNNSNETTVQGHVTIDFTLKEPVSQIIYHAKRMAELYEPALFEDGVNRLVTMRKYAPNDYVSLRLASANGVFSPNRYSLQQKFVISLIDGNIGFYQSTYKEGNETMEYSYLFFYLVVSRF